MAHTSRKRSHQFPNRGPDFFLGIVVLGQPTERKESLLTALHAAAFSVENFLNPIAKLLGPVDIIRLRVFIVERTDAVDSLVSARVKKSKK